jgi:hypothetical protein
VSVKSILREGDPAACILAEAAHGGADLIMMPTHGSNPFRLMLLGSVAARCLHAAECPVWIGPRAAAPSVSHIVCAMALGSNTSEGLEWALRLAAAYQCMLTVLHLAPRVDLAAEESSEPPWRCHPLPDCAPTTPESRHLLLETGDIARAVPMVAERLRADLLVLDRNPWDAAHLSTDAYAIIRSSSCPVLRL